MNYFCGAAESCGMEQISKTKVIKASNIINKATLRVTIEKRVIKHIMSTESSSVVFEYTPAILQ